MRVRKCLIGYSLILLLTSLSATAGAAPRAAAVRIYRPIPRVHYWGWGYPYWGWGWGWSPWYYGPGEVGVYNVDYGTVRFDVKPRNSKIYVDKKYLGTVSDLNGRHHEENLPRGYHDVKVVAPDGRKVERTVYLAAGQRLKFEQHF